MRMFRRLLAVPLLAWLVGCNQSMPASPTSPSLPMQPAASHLVSGIVAETVDGLSRPVADLRVDVYIGGTCGPPGNLGPGCRPERVDVVRTDQSGRYMAQVPTSRVFVFAQYAGLQPCLASAAVDRDTTLDVLVAQAGGSSTVPAAASPMITGFVYETTAQGRNPLRDAGVVLEVGFVESWPVARTRTDDAGRFFLCRVNHSPVQWEFVHVPVRLYVGASGYHLFGPLEILGAGDMFLDIELTR